ncbi:unnamed protein product [Dracunculus medinensis]|uniref:Rho-GAP domain-containing protein n=1 Tax=Dracunculus medinensis TaxID=318479 RepID=A0A3P7QJ41_DRAME|nr:unnamed protein product [Dracunculus medinensis]
MIIFSVVCKFNYLLFSPNFVSLLFRLLFPCLLFHLRFLVDAFNYLRTHGLNIEGIFRKEGNANRLKNARVSFPIYFGCTGIPEQYTVHDICSLIKRFFRELKLPLFAQLQGKIFTDFLIDITSMYEGMERIAHLLETVFLLPANHLATIVFLMRQLKYVRFFIFFDYFNLSLFRFIMKNLILR